MAHCSGLFFFFFFFLFFCFFPFLFSLPESSSLKEKVLEVIRTRKFQSTKIFCFSNNGRRKYEYNTTFLFVSIHNKLFSSFQVNKEKLLIDSLSWFHVYHACCLNIVLVEIKIGIESRLHCIDIIAAHCIKRWIPNEMNLQSIVDKVERRILTSGSRAGALQTLSCSFAAQH